MMFVSAPNDSIMMFLYISTYILSCCQHTRIEQDCLNIYGMINGLNKNRHLAQLLTRPYVTVMTPTMLQTVFMCLFLIPWKSTKGRILCGLVHFCILKFYIVSSLCPTNEKFYECMPEWLKLELIQQAFIEHLLRVLYCNRRHKDE